MQDYPQKHILIIGGSGLIGSNCYDCFKQQTNWQVYATHLSYPADDSLYLNPLQIEKSGWVFQKRWDAIIHTGALTHVDKCEIEPELSFELTVKSAEILVNFAKSLKAKFVYISTDYVFDGQNGPYSEKDLPNPLSVYGKHKLMAEKIVQQELDDFLIIRVTNVYGKEKRNKNFVARILMELEKNDEITIAVPVDQFATPINASDIAQALLCLIENNKAGLYHLGSTDYMNRAQVVDRIQQYYPEKRFNINRLKTSDMNQLAKRPSLGGLIAGKFLDEYPHFKFSNLDDFLKEFHG